MEENQKILLEAAEEKMDGREIKSKRRPNEKHFKRADGTYEARLYSEPVHYYDETTGSYEEYRSSFREEEEEYVTENGSFRAKFGKDMCREKAVEVSRNGYSVSWRALQWQTHTPPETNAGQFDEISEAPENAVVKYIAGDKELLYEAGKNYVRESIVVKQKAREYRYAFLLQTNGLMAEKEENAERIQLYPLEKAAEKKAIFTIPEPYMADAAGVCSSCVRYELCAIDTGKYILQVIADASWINEEKRIFPVTIDPDILVNDTGRYYATCESATVSEDGTRMLMHSNRRVGWSPRGENITYIQFALPAMDESYRLKSATVKLYQYGFKTNSNRIYMSVNRAGAPWRANSISWCSRPGSAEVIRTISTPCRKPDDALLINLDTVVKAWDSGQTPNYGIFLRSTETRRNAAARCISGGSTCSGGSSCGSGGNCEESKKSDYVDFYSEKSATAARRPEISIVYESVGQYMDNQETISFEVNRAGTTQVNLYTGGLLHIHEDVSAEGLKLPLSISHVYHTGVPRIGENEFGAGWKLSVRQRVLEKEYSTDDWVLKYFDAQGRTHFFERKSDGSVCDTSGLGLILTRYPDNRYYLTDEKGTQMIFAAGTGYIQKITDIYGNSMTFTYNTANQLSMVEDGCGHQARMYYQNGRLNKMEDSKGEETTYTYSGDNLIKITYPNGRYSSFVYDSLGNLTTVTDQTGLKYRYQYDSKNRMVRATQQASYAGIYQNFTTEQTSINGEITEIEYRGQSTAVSGSSKVKQIYNFDSQGRVMVQYQDASANSYMAEEPITPASISGYELLRNKRGYWYAAKYQSLHTAIRGGYYEAGEDCPEYRQNNLIQNGTFMYNNPGDQTPYGWSVQNGVGGCCDYGVAAESKFSNMRSYKAKGSWGGLMSIKQTVSVGSPKGNALIASAWLKGDTSSVVGGTVMWLALRLYYTDGSYASQISNYDPYYTGWQYTAAALTLAEGKQVSYAEVELCYGKHQGNAYFNNIRLEYSDAATAEQQIGAFGKISVFGNERCIKQQLVRRDKTGTVIEQIDEENNIVCRKKQKNGASYTAYYAYDSKHKVVKEQNYRGQITEYTYDGYGNVLMTKTYHKDKPGDYKRTQTVYESEGSYVKRELEERATYNGYTLSTDYLNSANTGKVTVKTETNGNQYHYDYDSETDELKSITVWEPGITHSLHYTHYLTLLTGISLEGMAYGFVHDGFGRIKSVSAGGSSLLSKEYTIGQRSTETTSYANGAQIGTVSDGRGNVIKKTYNGQTTATASYDAFGRMISGLDSAGNKGYNYYYDKDGNLIHKKINGVGNRYTYDAVGKVKSVYYGETGQQYTYSYDDAYAELPYEDSELDGVSLSGVYNSWLLRDGLRRPWRVTVTPAGQSATLIQKTYQYLKTDRQTGYVSKATELIRGVNNTERETYYTYDRAGNIATIGTSESGCEKTHGYWYDYLNRLTREDVCEANRRYEYTYDWKGNITGKKEYELDTGTLLSTKSYTYRSSGWTDQLIGYNGESISYDAIGNPTSYLGHSLSWSNVRRLSSYDGNTFSYNASGIRTKKNNITYTLDGSRILREERSEGTLTYYYGVEGLTGFRYNGVDYYYRKNLQGDIIGIINAVGTELVSYSYDAWGNILWTEDDSGRNLAELNPYRYRGYYYDAETGLYYLNSRYYDPKVGRFLNADAIDYLRMNGQFNCNLYIYCANNPVNMIDLTGNWPQWIENAISWVDQNIIQPIQKVGGAIAEDLKNYDRNNTSEEKVLQSNYFSCYKGVFVLRINGDRSGSFGAIFLTRETNARSNPEDVVRHEYGHTKQLEQLGLLKYAIFIGIPSWRNLGSGNYYDKPWEITADIYGGVESRYHSQDNINQGYAYLEKCKKIDLFGWRFRGRAYDQRNFFFL